jgi:peptidoglycan/LPS O-acetylase OafA/YrhL
MMAFVTLGLAVLRSRYWLGEGFAVNQAIFFLAGILSYFLFKYLPNLTLRDSRALTVTALLAAAFIYLAVPQPASLMLWVGVLWVVVAAQYSPMALPLRISGLARTPAVQWIGRISYSIYLVHFLVLYAISACLLAAFPHMPKAAMCAALMLLTTVCTLAVSSVTFVLVEAPAMAFGHRLAEILNRSVTAGGKPQKLPLPARP